MIRKISYDQIQVSVTHAKKWVQKNHYTVD
jgi:hypothetical protein